MKKIWVYLMLIAICTMFLSPHSSLARVNHRDENEGKVILVIMDRIGWKDIHQAHTPNLDKLMEMGAVGLMTTNTGGSLSQSNAYLTLGTGARVTGATGSQTAFFYSHRYQGEEIENLMYQIAGVRMAEGSIANPSIAKLYRENAKRPYTVIIGALGTALRDGGVKVAVLGNCDNYKRREDDGEGKNFLVSMMMDDRGIVPMGDISHSLIAEDPYWPMGIRTDYDKMLEAFKDLDGKAQIIAMQLGDTSRAEDFRHQSMDSRIGHHKRRALEEGDRFIGKLLEHFDVHRDYMMVLTPVGPAEEIGNNNRLTPIIVAGKGIKGDWLTSGSTHREGIVTNLDVGVSILNYFEISPLQGQSGAPIYSVVNGKGRDEILTFNNKLVEIYNQRPFLIKSYVYTIIPILALAALFLLFKRKYLKWIRPMLLFIMNIPFVYLILPILHQPTLFSTAVIAATMTVLLTASMCRLFKSTIDRIMIISGITVVALILDQWLGMRLIQSSPLGYDVIAGARFYGMGNEYMGVLVGAICCAGAAINERFSKQEKLIKAFMLVIGLVVLYTMVSPNLAANVGGTIALFVAISSTALLIRGKRVRVGSLMAIGAVLVFMLTAAFLLDSIRAVDIQSHMGKTTNAIRQNGLSELLKIFYRKISMNIRLFRTTQWTRVFLTSLGVIVLLLYRPVGIFRDVFRRHEILIKGLTGATIGAIAALLFNDSGIVSAATAMIFVAPPFVLMIMDEVEKKVMDGVWQDGIRFKTSGS